MDIQNVIYLLDEQLQPLARKVKIEMPRWISTPEGDHGDEWCFDCGYYKVRNLRRHDRKKHAEYFLDGGWCTEDDNLLRCVSCGVNLATSLTDYGVGNELENLSEYGFFRDDNYTAFVLSNILSNILCQDDKHNQEVIELTMKFLKVQKDTN